MRLISNTHDYYDGVVRNSVGDQTLTFVRTFGEKWVKDRGVKWRLPRIQSALSAKYEYSFDVGIIGFCGKIYPYIHVHQTKKNTYGGHVRDLIFYTWEDFESWLPDDLMPDYWYTRRRAKYIQYDTNDIKRWLIDGIISGQRYTNHQSDTNVRTAKHITDTFENERVAYFHYTYGNFKRYEIKLELYPNLTALQFYKVFDAYSCFQEIEMFLSNVLVKPDDPYIEPVPDKIMAEGKGFNKFSFRKDPTKKRKKEK